MMQYETMQDLLREAMNLLLRAEPLIPEDNPLSTEITDWLDANG